MTRAFSLVVLAIGALALTDATAQAQNKITYGQIITNLNTTGEAARKVGINIDAMRADIAAHIAAEGTENAKQAPDVLDALKQLPNFSVQIQFDLDSDTIRPESWQTVGQIADALYHPLMVGNRFLVAGHTDARGKRPYNVQLSERRAAAVVRMLTTVFKVDPSRLVPIGFGEEQLLDPTKPDDGVNRRVELINLGPA